MNTIKLAIGLILGIFVSALIVSIVMIIIAAMGFDNASPYFGVPVFILLCVSAIARFVREERIHPKTA